MHACTKAGFGAAESTSEDDWDTEFATRSDDDSDNEEGVSSYTRMLVCVQSVWKPHKLSSNREGIDGGMTVSIAATLLQGIYVS